MGRGSRKTLLTQKTSYAKVQSYNRMWDVLRPSVIYMEFTRTTWNNEVSTRHTCGEDAFQGAPITPNSIRMEPWKHIPYGDVQKQVVHLPRECEQMGWRYRSGKHQDTGGRWTHACLYKRSMQSKRTETTEH